MAKFDRRADSSQPRPPSLRVSRLQAKNTAIMSANMSPAPPTHITAPPMCTSLIGLGAQPGRCFARAGNGLLPSEPRTRPVKASTGMAMKSRKIRDG